MRTCKLCGEKAGWLAPRTPIGQDGPGLWAFLCDRHYEALPYKQGRRIDLVREMVEDGTLVVLEREAA